MSYPNAIEVCRAELFTKEVELRERYPQALVDKVLRVREMYNWFIIVLPVFRQGVKLQ